MMAKKLVRKVLEMLRKLATEDAPEDDDQVCDWAMSSLCILVYGPLP